MYREVEEGRRSYRELGDNGIDNLFPLYPAPRVTCFQNYCLNS